MIVVPVRIIKTLPNFPDEIHKRMASVYTDVNTDTIAVDMDGCTIVLPLRSIEMEARRKLIEFDLDQLENRNTLGEEEDDNDDEAGYR